MHGTLHPVRTILGQGRRDLPTGWPTVCGLTCEESAMILQLNCCIIMVQRATPKNQILLLVQMHVLTERGVSQRKQITSVLQRPNWLPIYFWMPFQMLIYKAVWYRTRAKATVARLSLPMYGTAEKTLLLTALGVRENGEPGSLSLGP